MIVNLRLQLKTGTSNRMLIERFPISHPRFSRPRPLFKSGFCARTCASYASSAPSNTAAWSTRTCILHQAAQSRNERPQMHQVMNIPFLALHVSDMFSRSLLIRENISIDCSCSHKVMYLLNQDRWISHYYMLEQHIIYILYIINVYMKEYIIKY